MPGEDGRLVVGLAESLALVWMGLRWRELIVVLLLLGALLGRRGGVGAGRAVA